METCGLEPRTSCVIDKIISRIKSFMTGESLKEARLSKTEVNGILEYAEDLRKAFVDMTVNARENMMGARSGETEESGNTKFQIREIVDEDGKDYGAGVYLDSTLLTGLSDEERKEMVKEYVKKELAGVELTAYDNNGNPVTFVVAENKNFRNDKGKIAPANKDLATKYRKESKEIKQEAIPLIDELVTAAKYFGNEPSRKTHGWVDNNGANNWDYWTVYLQDKNNAVYDATLNIANDINGRKILYDIDPIKKVATGSVESDPAIATDMDNTTSANKSQEVLRKNQQRDEKYLAAVNSGDMETAQKMVDEAAKEAGFTVKAYHGSNKYFTVFDNTGRKGSNSPDGAYFFSTNPDIAYSYTFEKNKVNLNTNNNFSVYNGFNRDGEREENRVYKGGLYESYLKINNPFTVDFEGKRWSTKVEGKNINEWAKYAKDRGYDGLIAKNIIDQGDMGGKDFNENVKFLVADDYIVFASSQIKSADPVTYDDSGNVIPLSERFNEGNEDIRYQQRLDQQIDNWDNKTVGFSFNFGKPSQVLLDAQIPNKEIRLDATKLLKTLRDHEGITKDTIKGVYDLLQNPIIVIDSKTDDESRIIMGDLKDSFGKTVTTVLLLDPKSNKGNLLDIIKISSIEGRSHISSLFLKDNGELVHVRYADKKRIQEWLNVSRVQSPLRSSILDSIGIIPQSSPVSQEIFSQGDTNSYQLRSDGSLPSDIDLLIEASEDIKTGRFTDTEKNALNTIKTTLKSIKDYKEKREKNKTSKSGLNKRFLRLYYGGDKQT